MMLSEFASTVRHAQASEFWFGAGVVIALAAAAAWGAFVFLKRRRVIEDLPTALIRSAPQGYIELQGHAELMDGDPIYAPLSTRLCVWYQYKVEKREDRRSNGRSDARWVTVDQGRSDDLFYLVDATGRCAIDPDGAAVTPAHRNIWYGSTRIPGRYHESDGVWWARALGRLGKAYRYTERRIEPGEALYAIGNFTTHGGGASRFDLEGAVGDCLREWKRDQAFMLQHFDANGDGQIDMDEWQQARAQAEKTVLDARTGHGGGPPPCDVLGATADRRRPFVIHAGSEEEILARYRLYASALLMIGLPGLIAALWAVALRLNG